MARISIFLGIKKEITGKLLSLVSAALMLGTVQARAQAAHLFLLDHPVHETWYKKALDACMQSWGDLREIGREIGIKQECAPEAGRELMIIDAAVGRLHYADLCLKNLCAKPVELGDDDIWYLWRIMQEFDVACAKLEQTLYYKERAACARVAAQQVRDRLAKYSYTVDEAFFYQDSSYKDSSSPQPNS